MLANGIASAGDVDAALALFEEAIEQIELHGREDRLYYAEILRVTGTLLAAKGHAQGAKASYLQSLESARKQQARGWELRTASSLARLLQQEGKIEEARALLAPVYGWFSEGFDTADLTSARQLLAELG